MRFLVIACESIFREASQAAASSPHICDLVFLPFGLHDSPEKLRLEVQRQIDCVSYDQAYDAILLGYGLCSRGTADVSTRSIPIVIPRVHDCITLFLGSREHYAAEFGEHPGTYYFTSGWIERKDGDADQGSSLHDAKLQARYQEYVERFGEDNAEYLIEQEKGWLRHYNRAAFINTGVGDVEYYRRFTREVAESKGWASEEIPGNTRLIDLLFAGEWNSAEFLVVQPGQTTVEAVNSEIISAR